MTFDAMKTLDALLEDLFDGRPHALRPAMQQWLATSRRFAAFVEDNRDKIRKKIRLKQAPEEAADLQWELEVAHQLHEDKHFSVRYEAYIRAQPFGPDFRVRYTTSMDFNVEVTRVRSAIAGDDPQHAARRLAETACNKLRQMMPNMPNVVAIGVLAIVTDEAGFAAAMTGMRRSAEQRDAVVLSRLGFDSTPAFIKAVERLSAVIVCKAASETPVAFLWQNPQAKAPLPAKIVTALRTCFIAPAYLK
jgi:hypothetical protein